MRKQSDRPAYAVQEEFVDKCSKVACCVCSVCGGSDFADVDLVANKGRCLNPQCESRQHRIGRGGGQTGIVPLAPAMDAIYGELSLRDGGTGEQADGQPSISAVRRKLLEKHPVGKRIGEREPTIREWAMGRDVANRGGRRATE